MAEHTAHADPAGLEPLLEAARKQLDTDATRLLRALRAVPADDPDGVTLEVFAAIATARRHTFASFGKIRSLVTDDPAKADALAALSTLAAALGSWYRSLRTADPATRRREGRLANERFATATTILERLDTRLGGTPGHHSSTASHARSPALPRAASPTSGSRATRCSAAASQAPSPSRHWVT
jgi:hypothetical protein